MKKKYNTTVSKNITKEQLIHLLQRTKDVSKIAKELGIHRTTLYYILRKHKIKPQDVKFNHKFFQVIDDESTAYWLGFLYADGCVFDKKETLNTSKSLHLRLSQKDECHINLFKRSLSCCLRTHYFNGSAWIKLSSNQLCDDLIQHGCVPRKSLILTFPAFLPKHLIHHFVRGYFDGDGSVGIKKNKSLRISIVGTEKFLNELQEILYDELGISKVKLSKDGRAFVYAKSGNTQVKRIYAWFYKDSSLFLDRKRQKFILGGCTL